MHDCTHTFFNPFLAHRATLAFVEQARLDHVSDVECTDQAIEEMRQNYLRSDLQEDPLMDMIP